MNPVARQQQEALAGVRSALNEEYAGALGASGRRLQQRLAALAAHDDGRPDPFRPRERLLREAAEALYSYVIQKEALGVADERQLNAAFKVPREVWLRLGVIETGVGR